MNQTSQPLPLVISRLLLIILSFAFTGLCVISFMTGSENLSDNDFSDIAYFSIDWIGVQSHQEPMLITSDISIFALFIVFLGGRSKSRWFNDRTIKPINSSLSFHPKTALYRVVFYFCQLTVT